MSHFRNRWFDSFASTQYYQDLLTSCEPGKNPEFALLKRQDRAKQPLVISLIVAGLTAAAFLLLVFAVSTGNENPNQQPAYLLLTCMFVGVVGMSGLITYLISSSGHSTTQKRMDSVQEFCQTSGSLEFVGHINIEGDVVGSLPWFITEEFEHLHGLAVGAYQGNEICFVECDQTIDPVLKATDSQIVQAVSQLAVRKDHRMRKRDMEVVVFGDQLMALPDLLIVPRNDVNRAYFKRALKGASYELPLPKVLAKQYWAIASEPMHPDEFLSVEFVKCLAQKEWAMVQIIGGTLCVFTQQWDGAKPENAATTASEIEKNLNFATEIFHQLRAKCELNQIDAPEGSEHFDAPAFDQGSSGGTATATATWEQIKEGLCKSESAPADPEPANFDSAELEKYEVTIKTKRVKHSPLVATLLLGMGIPMIGLGGTITGLSGLQLYNGMNSRNWPTAKATIVQSEIESTPNLVDNTLPPLQKPVIRYEYSVDGQQYTGDQLYYGKSPVSSDFHQAQALVAKFAKGLVLDAKYNPSSPDEAVLIAGVAGKSQLTAVLGTGFIMSLMGIGMVGIFWCGREVKA